MLDQIMNSDSLKKILLLLPSFNLYIFLLLYYSNLTLINSVGIPHKCELGWSIGQSGGVQMPGPSGLNQLNSSTATSTSAQEHRRLFAPRRNPSVRGNSGRGKGKRIPTCTLKFFCLSRVNASKPPTGVRERTLLLNAGLGDASIQFRMDCSNMESHQEIVSTISGKSLGMLYIFPTGLYW